MAIVISPQSSPSQSERDDFDDELEDEEELRSVPENIKNQTKMLFYEYVDSWCSYDRDLSKEQVSLLHESASTCIRKTDVGGQGERDERLANILRKKGDKFQKELEKELETVREQAIEVICDTDTGKPSTSSCLAHIESVIEKLFGVNPDGGIIVQNITFGRIASLFYYIYSLCKRLLNYTFKNYTFMQTMCALGGYLVVSLVRVKFLQWLSDQGGWYKAIVNVSTSVTLPGWSNHIILASGVFLIGLWAYRMYKGP